VSVAAADSRRRPFASHAVVEPVPHAPAGRPRHL